MIHASYVEVDRYANLAHPEGQGYGCWFILRQGSGLWVDVGRRTKRFDTRHEAAEWLCGAERAHTACQSKDRHGRNVSLTGRVPLCQLPGCGCECRSDAWWAMRAHLLGLDSVQILSGAPWRASGSATPQQHQQHQQPHELRGELLVATRPCLTQPAPLGACPPLPLLVGPGSSRNTEGKGDPALEACTLCDDMYCEPTTPDGGADGASSPADDNMAAAPCPRLRLRLRCASSSHAARVTTGSDGTTTTPAPPRVLHRNEFERRYLFGGLQSNSSREARTNAWRRRRASIEAALLAEAVVSGPKQRH